MKPIENVAIVGFGSLGAMYAGCFGAAMGPERVFVVADTARTERYRAEASAVLAAALTPDSAALPAATLAERLLGAMVAFGTARMGLTRIVLQAGANWSECERGTNAIGASLIERAPVEVLGAEHYLDCNGVLTCSAAPIFDWRGELLGALDISGDHRSHQPHTLGLARMGVRLVERRLFESEHARHALLSFHPRPEGVGGLQEGLLAIDPDGEIVAADRQARALLGVDERRVAGLGTFSNLFRGGFGTLIGRAARDPAAMRASGEAVLQLPQALPMEVQEQALLVAQLGAIGLDRPAEVERLHQGYGVAIPHSPRLRMVRHLVRIRALELADATAPLPAPGVDQGVPPER